MPPLVELHLNGSYSSTHMIATDNLDLVTAEALDAELARCESEIMDAIATSRTQVQTRIEHLSHLSLFDWAA